jgi:hypothetical protein
MRTMGWAVVAGLVAGEAHAEQPVELPVTTVRVVERAPLLSTSASGTRSTRAFVDDREVIPGERQVGAELSYLTSDQGLEGRPVRFTDLVAARLTGRASLGQRFELAGRLEVLAKQPFPGGQSPFAGGALTGRVQLAPRGALFLGAGAAPLAGSPGATLGIGAGWSRRAFIDPQDRYVAFAAALGAQGTHLLSRFGPPPQLLEMVADGALQGMASDGEAGFGFEVGTTLAVPAWRTGRAFWIDGAPPFDARTRVDFHLAGYFTIARRWDLFVRWAALDRGDPTAPASRLPLLLGGHDQTELTFGASYRFGPNVEEAR